MNYLLFTNNYKTVSLLIIPAQQSLPLKTKTHSPAPAPATAGNKKVKKNWGFKNNKFKKLFKVFLINNILN